MAQFAEEVRFFIIDNFLFGQGGEDLEAGDSLMEKGIIDSTGVLELIVFLENTYGIQVEDEDLIPDNLDSIANLACYIERKVNGVEAVRK
jgi:acyl carrier protein